MKSFCIKNIKSFRNSGEIILKPITILVGKNSCGKSSLLRFPALLSQTANYPDKNPPLSFFGDLVDFGNFEDVVFGKRQNEISFSISYNVDISESSLIIQRFNGVDMYRQHKLSQKILKKATIAVCLKRKDKAVKVKRVSVDVDEYHLSNLEWNEDENVYKLTLSASYENKKIVQLDEEIIIRFKQNEVDFDKFIPIYLYNGLFEAITRSIGYEINNDELPSKIERYIFYKSKGIDHKDELSDKEQKVAEIYEKFNFSAVIMANIYYAFNAECRNFVSYIGPFRQRPDRIYRYSEAKKIHVGAKGEKLGDILVEAYQNKDSIYDELSK